MDVYAEDVFLGICLLVMWTLLLAAITAMLLTDGGA